MMGDIQEKMMNYKQKMLNELLELKDIEYFDLSESEEKRVLELLLNMPFDNQSLLIFKNYYKHTFDEIKPLEGFAFITIAENNFKGITNLGNINPNIYWRFG